MIKLAVENPAISFKMGSVALLGAIESLFTGGIMERKNESRLSRESAELRVELQKLRTRSPSFKRFVSPSRAWFSYTTNYQTLHHIEHKHSLFLTVTEEDAIFDKEMHFKKSPTNRKKYIDGVGLEDDSYKLRRYLIIGEKWGIENRGGTTNFIKWFRKWGRTSRGGSASTPKR